MHPLTLLPLLAAPELSAQTVKPGPVEVTIKPTTNERLGDDLRSELLGDPAHFHDQILSFVDPQLEAPVDAFGPEACMVDASEYPRVTVYWPERGPERLSDELLVVGHAFENEEPSLVEVLEAQVEQRPFNRTVNVVIAVDDSYSMTDNQEAVEAVKRDIFSNHQDAKVTIQVIRYDEGGVQVYKEPARLPLLPPSGAGFYGESKGSSLRGAAAVHSEPTSPPALEFDPFAYVRQRRQNRRQLNRQSEEDHNGALSWGIDHLKTGDLRYFFLLTDEGHKRDLDEGLRLKREATQKGIEVFVVYDDREPGEDFSGLKQMASSPENIFKMREGEISESLFKTQVVLEDYVTITVDLMPFYDEALDSYRTGESRLYFPVGEGALCVWNVSSEDIEAAIDSGRLSLPDPAWNLEAVNEELLERASDYLFFLLCCFLVVGARRRD